MELASECDGCARAKGNKCMVISDPVGIWRKGRCWAYTLDPHWFEKFSVASKNYTTGKVVLK